MKKLKYALDVSRILNDDFDLAFEEFKYFNSKKEALDYAFKNNYLDSSKFYTKLWNRLDYIMLT